MGTRKLYNWYDVLHEAAELVAAGEINSVTALAAALKIPRPTVNEALRRELGITAKTLDQLPALVDQLKEPEIPDPMPRQSRPHDAVSPDAEKSDKPQKEEYEFNADGSKSVRKIIELSESEMNDPIVIMRKMGLDPLKWKLLKCVMKRESWDVSMKLSQGSDANGNKAPEIPHKETNYLYECQVNVEPLQELLDQATIRAVFDELADSAPRLKSVKHRPGDLMLELGIYDLHLGKQAWKDETGEEHYDLEIAEADYRNTISMLLARTRSYRFHFDRILFPVGQDFFHIDTKQETTTAGTHVDTDGRWQWIYQTGVGCLVAAIEELRKLAPVHVVYVPGNHDEMMSFFATLHLEARFKDLESVTVDTSPTMRKYIRFGNNLIGLSHGRDEGKRIEKLMQVEAPEDWGQTRYREFHLGDLHHEESWEDGGIIFRRISALTAPDAWHAEKGYKGAVRKAQAFVWDRERGLETVLQVAV